LKRLHHRSVVGGVDVRGEGVGYEVEAGGRRVAVEFGEVGEGAAADPRARKGGAGRVGEGGKARLARRQAPGPGAPVAGGRDEQIGDGQAGRRRGAGEGGQLHPRLPPGDDGFEGDGGARRPARLAQARRLRFPVPAGVEAGVQPLDPQEPQRLGGAERPVRVLGVEREMDRRHRAGSRADGDADRLVPRTHGRRGAALHRDLDALREGLAGRERVGEAAGQRRT
jgi:hypothetical protein